MPHVLTRTAWLSAPLLAMSLVLPASAEDARQYRAGNVSIEVTPIAGGLEHPWSVEVLPDGAYIVSERPGRMRIIRDGEVGRPLGGLPRIAAVGQGGLLDIALAPDFAQSRRYTSRQQSPAPAARGQASFPLASARMKDGWRMSSAFS